jgi:transposase
VLWEFERVRTLQSTIDKKFEEIKAYLIDRVGHEELAVPTEELRQELATIAQWRSPGRLYGWARKAKEAGLADVELENWRRKQMHLYQWAANLQDQVVKRRRYIYRNFAAQIAGHYDRIILEEFDLRRVAEHAQPEAKEEAVETRAARYRQIASISELRTTLENTAAREGTQIEKREARLTTQRCHVCGNTARWDAAESVIHRCDLCQSVWDQDYNAAQNLLREFADRPVLEAKA